MSINSIKINNLRNLESVALDLSSQINVLYGANGSGKTSFLEAIYLLGMGRGMRSAKSSILVQHGKEYCTVFAKINGQMNLMHSLGVRRNKNNELHIHLDQETITKTAKLIDLLPLQVIDYTSFNLVDGIPKVRRQFLDWGVFHAQSQFLMIWRRTNKALKQRNAWLKKSLDYKNDVWGQELENASNELDNYRAAYVTDLEPVFRQIMRQIIDSLNVTLTYYRGWDINKSLSVVLASNYVRDKTLGFSSFGPQKADIRIKANGQNASEVLSRGQQKLVAYALLLAQGYLLNETKRTQCIYLIDDLSAELDAGYQKIICALLENLSCQVFITTTNKNDFCANWQKSTPFRLFYVKQGTISQQE